VSWFVLGNVLIRFWIRPMAMEANVANLARPEVKNFHLYGL